MAPPAAEATHQAVVDGVVTQPCEVALLAYVSVAGQQQPVREDDAMSFSGADAETLLVDSAIAGYPVPERHAQLFAGAETEPLADESVSADCPPA